MAGPEPEEQDAETREEAQAKSRLTRMASVEAIREAARRHARERSARRGKREEPGAEADAEADAEGTADATADAAPAPAPAPPAPRRRDDAREKRSEDAPLRIVPDTSVVVDGRITLLVKAGEYQGVEIVVPQAVIAELEAHANRGTDAGYNGLDELVSLLDLAKRGLIQLRYTGVRPSFEEVELARSGEIDAMIREVAEAEQAMLLTSDKVQAQVCAATGIPYRYLRAVQDRTDVEELTVLRFLKEDVMSVHLKQDQPPFVKRGRPGALTYERLPEPPLKKPELNRLAREIVEAARRDDRSFVEIERNGATVVQLREMRIAVSRPPFSEAIEITVVRPIVKLDIEDYDLPAEVLARLSETTRGVFVSGPPGSGKSTFAQAVAEHLFAGGAVVKTMESPRDLQLRGEITQYAPLERDIELTGDFLLLVRPDFVIYDEVRKTRDFEVFADMRLAGVGLIGVTHANRAIDAVQRLIGRVELGMIPQVVDTVVHIEGGKIRQILEMEFTVRVPSGMTEADLARPVIRVRDFATKREVYEIYTYGEQVVVMPIQSGGNARTGTERLAEGALARMLERNVEGPFEVELAGGNRATLWVEDWEVPTVIGRGGSRVQALERKTGVKLDVRPLSERRGKGGGGLKRKSVAAEWAQEEAGPSAENGLVPAVRFTKKQVVLAIGPEYGGEEVEVTIDGHVVAHGHLSHKGEMRLARRAPEGKRVEAAARGRDEIRLGLL